MIADFTFALIHGQQPDPFAILGPHIITTTSETVAVVRAFLPMAESVTLQPTTTEVLPRQMTRLHSDGVFEVLFPGQTVVFPYQLEVVDQNGQCVTIDDPYRFPSTLSNFDLYLMGEGTHYQQHEKFGAHPITIDGVAGVLFIVWAPNARRVSVVGDFNHWDGRVHVMRHHPSNGLWELFLPGVTVGAHYKYEILAQDGELLALKADPYAFAFEPETPRTASVVADLTYQWQDDEWMATRAQRQTLSAPLAIYELHLGSWKRVPEEGNRFLTYRELAHALVPYLQELGFTHVELLPVMEHPFYGSWGYQVIGYFAPTRRYGMPTDFMYFVDYLHQHGLGVILDWVPAHFPRDPHGLVYFDGTHLYEHADPRQGAHREWGTLIFNYGRTEVANFLINNALFWLDRYHLDGLRIDAVASMLYLDYAREPGDWIPNRYGGNENLEAVAFVKRLNEVVYQYHPDVLTIAEESTSWSMVSRPTSVGGLGFGLKWNMGWMHDLLDYMHKDPVHRKFHHTNLTFGLLYAWSENFVLPLSHDEVVYGKGSLHHKMPGDDWQKFANLRLFFAFMYGHPGKKLLFMGGEFGQTSEWDHERSLDWHLLEAGPYHRGLQRLIQDLNRLYREQSALHERDDEPGGFQWIDCHDADQSVVSFERRAKNEDDRIVMVCNFTAVPRHAYRVGVPTDGYWAELLNTDAALYGGSNRGSDGGVWAQAEPTQGQPYSLVLTLPPLAALLFRRISNP